MKKNLLYPILCLIIFSGLFSSCLNSIDDLYDQYNENFTKNMLLEQYLSQKQTEEEEIEDKILTPNDEGFDEEEKPVSSDENKSMHNGEELNEN